MDWEDFHRIVEDYLDESDIKTESVIRMLLNKGDEDEENRLEITKSVKGMLKGNKGSPFGTGSKSIIPVKVRIVIKEIGKIVYNASIEYFDSVPSGLIRKHGKSGGGGYASAKEYALVERNKIEIALQRRFTDGKWDGTRQALGYEDSHEFL
jgi:hypothetical protein|tara:strand:- start:137 stop:592 length:456 start_codon:yes stop_codon:yes gene_type:complete